MLIGVLAIICLLSYHAKTGTAAWFVSETTATGSLVNAETADLVDIKSTVVSYSDDGIAHVEVNVTNEHESMIPIQIGDVQKNIEPGETVTAQISKHISEKATSVVIPFIGFENYIDEVIEVPLEQKSVETMKETTSGMEQGEVVEQDDEANASQEETMALEEDEAVQSEDAETASEKSEQDKTAEHKKQKSVEEKPGQYEGVAKEKPPTFGNQAEDRNSAEEAPEEDTDGPSVKDKQ